MERRLKCFATCVLLSSVMTAHLFGQDSRRIPELILVNEKIEAFEIQRIQTEKPLPFRHPMDLKIKAVGDLDSEGETTLVITLETENWYGVAGRPNTYYIKDFRARLVSAPGAIFPRKPRIIQHGPDKEKLSYNAVVPNSFSAFNELLCSFEYSDYDELAESNRTMNLPFCIPASWDTDARIRAFEMHVPLDIRHPGAPLKLIIDHIEMGFLVDGEEPEYTPYAADLVFDLVNGEPDYLAAENSPANNRLFFKNHEDKLNQIDWELKGSLSGNIDDAHLDFQLTHHSPDRYTGIKKITIGFMTNDGAVQLKAPMVYQYPEGSGFSGQDRVMLMSVPESNERMYEEMAPGYSIAQLVSVDPRDHLYGNTADYCSFIEDIWKHECLWDIFILSEYVSDWNYPLSKDAGTIEISLPCNYFSDGISEIDIEINVTFLTGDSKAALTEKETILSFTGI